MLENIAIWSKRSHLYLPRQPASPEVCKKIVRYFSTLNENSIFLEQLLWCCARLEKPRKSKFKQIYDVLKSPITGEKYSHKKFQRSLPIFKEIGFYHRPIISLLSEMMSDLTDEEEGRTRLAYKKHILFTRCIPALLAFPHAPLWAEALTECRLYTPDSPIVSVLKKIISDASADPGADADGEVSHIEKYLCDEFKKMYKPEAPKHPLKWVEVDPRMTHISSGTYGRVFETTVNGEPCAVKLPVLKKGFYEYNSIISSQEMIEYEVAGVIKPIGVAMVENIALVMPLGTPVVLRRELTMENCLQLSEGLKNIHSAGFLHRDIKIENVVFSGGTTVWVDFDTCCINHPYIVPNKNIYTPSYRPIEIHPKTRIDFPEAADVWALGKTIYGIHDKIDRALEGVFCANPKYRLKLEDIISRIKTT